MLSRSLLTLELSTSRRRGTRAMKEGNRTQQWIQSISRNTMNRINEAFGTRETDSHNLLYHNKLNQWMFRHSWNEFRQSPGSQWIEPMNLLNSCNEFVQSSASQWSKSMIHALPWIEYINLLTLVLYGFSENLLLHHQNESNPWMFQHSYKVFRRITMIWLNKCSFTQKINSDNLVRHNSIPFHSCPPFFFILFDLNHYSQNIIPYQQLNHFHDPFHLFQFNQSISFQFNQVNTHINSIHPFQFNHYLFNYFSSSIPIQSFEYDPFHSNISSNSIQSIHHFNSIIWARSISFSRFRHFNSINSSSSIHPSPFNQLVQFNSSISIQSTRPVQFIPLNSINSSYISIHLSQFHQLVQLNSSIPFNQVVQFNWIDSTIPIQSTHPFQFNGLVQFNSIDSSISTKSTSRVQFIHLNWINAFSSIESIRPFQFNQLIFLNSI